MAGGATIIGAQLIELPTAESTNKTAAELLRLSKLRHGAVILAHEQMAGRGQRGRSWTSGPGLDLTFSIVVRPPSLRADAQFVLAKLAALAVHDTVRGLVKGDVRIKWPNDILVDRRKLAGILIQNDLAGDQVSWSIIGIGLNVNTQDFPAELLATSLGLETGQVLDRMVLLRALCAHFERRWAAWEARIPDWEQAYSDLLWARGRWTTVDLDDAFCSVRPVDVDPQGRLIVEHEDGKVAAYGLDRLRFGVR